ncbi:hypothetical protein [Ensifer adhaerens]
MSRYTVKVKSATNADPDATIGYDRPLGTFFLQAFPDPQTDECALWLGAFLEEYTTLEPIVEEARTQGYEVRGLTREMLLAMIKEPRPSHPPSLAKDWAWCGEVPRPANPNPHRAGEVRDEGSPGRPPLVLPPQPQQPTRCSGSAHFDLLFWQPLKAAVIS